MRLLLAMMKHETNTFSPIPTDLQRFRDWGLHEGAADRRADLGHGVLAVLGEIERPGRRPIPKVLDIGP